MRRGAPCAALLLFSVASLGQVVPDPAFNPSVSKPAYRDAHPRVVIDEAHSNYHTVAGRYRPFAELMAHDGYAVSPGTEKFSAASLARADILVIANARAGDGPPHARDDVFTAAECSAVATWVESGGRLLLIADHAPFGAAARSLGMSFGVEMGKGHVFDPERSTDDPTSLLFNRDDGSLADHPITRGRDASEAVHRVVSFDGQSLGVPRGAVALLVLGAGARESEDTQQLESNVGKPVSGRAQGLAITRGRGRVVVMGEAAMFTAQVYEDLRFGMNTPGNDDRQLALNVMHWLSGAL
jgi:hypothetical protein